MANGKTNNNLVSINLDVVKAVAFDCFGTLFDMAGFPEELVREYVKHVQQATFTEFKFSRRWYALKARPGVAASIRALQSAGVECYAMSNGDVSLLNDLSKKSDIHWNGIVDFVKAGVYKPAPSAYLQLEQQFGVAPEATLMVTGNPTFGDIEGALATGMQAAVINNGFAGRDGHYDSAAHLAVAIITR